MAEPAIFDAEFLKARERDAQEAANEAQFEADWEQADAQLGREFSDTRNGYRHCPHRACRRARRCTGDDLLCLDQIPARLPRAVAQPMIEEIYAEIQEERRDTAEALAMEGCAEDDQ